MDFKTARELDLVLSCFSTVTSWTTVNLNIKGQISYDVQVYIDRLKNDRLIEIVAQERGTYKQTFEGLTFLGFEKKLIEEGKLKREQKWKYFLSTFAGGLIGLLGVLLGHKLTQIRETDKTNSNDFPKIQIVHDTIYVSRPIDTSLVRLVKLPAKK